MLRWRSLGDFCRLVLRGAGRSLVDQCPELGSPTSEAHPDAWLEHQEPVIHTAQNKREKKKKEIKSKIK